MRKLTREEMLARALPLDVTIGDAIEKMSSVLPKYERVVCSVSGGRDSDVMLDLCWNLDADDKVRYIWFDTGLEYRATKDHLNFLEEKYGIRIERVRAIQSIPKSVKEYGQPFLSKQVSSMIERLQRHGFEWKDEPYAVLCEKYPTITSSIKWWCNEYADCGNGQPSSLNIHRFKYLKGFLIANPPSFPISSKCCKFAKKDVAKRYYRREKIQLAMTGIRKAEGGIRTMAYTNCFSANDKGPDLYRPLFWFSSPAEEEYIQAFGIESSDCYSKWGFKRTGCVGCPNNPKLADEIDTVRQHEPASAKACEHVFADSYAYTKLYRDYIASVKGKG